MASSKSSSNNYTAGIVLIIIGVLLLLRKIGISFPSFLFEWYMIPIAIGIYLGSKRNFGEPYGWTIPIGIGLLFAFGDVFPIYDILHFTLSNLFRFIVPLILIGIGLITILKNNNKKDNNPAPYSKNKYPNADYIPFTESNDKPSYSAVSKTDTYMPHEDQARFSSASATQTPPQDETKKGAQSRVDPNDTDFLNGLAIMSGLRKNVSSQNFKGGSITTLMGGAEIDLLHADMQNTAVIHLSQFMGGTSLKVPQHWVVKDEVTSLMGGIEDARQPYVPAEGEPRKILTIKGFNIMGGVEIKNF